MSEHRPEELDPNYGAREDTAETGLAARIPLLRWYRKTTAEFSQSRWLFMPIGFLSLSALAFYLGFPDLEELVNLLLYALHRGFAGLGDALGADPESSVRAVLDLSARRELTPILALLWAAGASIHLSLWSLAPPEREERLGYVIPGSGFFARLRGAVGLRLHRLRQALAGFLAYLRDLNLLKLHLPLTIPALLATAGVSLKLALENLLFEIPARLPALQAQTGWIPWAAGAAAGMVVLVLGWPMLAWALARAHRRSIKRREQEPAKFIRRRLAGILGTALVFVPVAWMLLRLTSGGI